MDKGSTNYGFDEVRREMRSLIAPVISDITTIRDDISRLGTTVAEQAAVNYAEIVNIQNNSFPEWSKDAYTTAGITPTTAGDGNLECYGFFRETQAETDITIDAGNPVKTAKTTEPADHTLWAANEAVNLNIPRWDKTNAWIEMGGVSQLWDIFTPMPNDVVFPGQTFYFQFEARLATGSLPTGLQFYAGFYDNTAGQRKYIEGGTFTITGQIFGNQSGSGTVSYKVLARTDSGEEAISNTLTFTNAPATFDQNNHPRVSFSGVAGFIEFEIYRQIGTSFVLQYTVTNSIEGTYYDVGNPPQAVVAAFPVVTTTRPRAYTVTTTFAPGSINGTDFVRHELTIFVPTTYNRAATTAGTQFLRFGLSGLTDSARQIQIRKLGLSLGSGNWSRSSNDVRPDAHSSPSTTATGSPGGNTGGVDPPGTGGYCVLTDTLFDCLDASGSKTKTPLSLLSRGQLLETGGAICGRTVKIKRGYASRIYRIKSANGCEMGCTWDHPLITSWADMFGTGAAKLKARFDKGEAVEVLTRPFYAVESSVIIEMAEEYGDFPIGMPVMEGSHICITNGFLSHNRKDPTDDIS